MNNYEGFIGIHLGAGNHSVDKINDYKLLCQTATRKAVQMLRDGKPAVNVVVQAVEILENSPLTNAGYGSNLTENGTVECDAGIMDGDSLLFGGVGAVSGIKNPVTLAKKLIDEQKVGLKELGRVPPCCLVGPAVKQWACNNGIETCQTEEMISDGAKRSFKNYKRKLIDARCNSSSLKLQRLEDVCKINAIPEEVSDTVGAVACDQFGNVASATSSGGIALKQCGRLGQAAIYGCGCWSQNGTAANPTSLAVSTSGCGEYLIRTSFAKECAEAMRQDSCSVIQLKDFLEKGFLDSPFLRNVTEKLAGAIIFKRDHSCGMGEFLWCHTTHSMCIGYMSTADKQPKFRMSQLPEDGKPGINIVVEGVTQNLGRHKTTVTTSL